MDSATVSLGFFKFDETVPRLARDPRRFQADLRRQVTSGARWQLVTSFNEWCEGTAVEPAAIGSPREDMASTSKPCGRCTHKRPVQLRRSRAVEPDHRKSPRTGPRLLVPLQAASGRAHHDRSGTTRRGARMQCGYSQLTVVPCLVNGFTPRVGRRWWAEYRPDGGQGCDIPGRCVLICLMPVFAASVRALVTRVSMSTSISGHQVSMVCHSRQVSSMSAAST
jgi:hypothetical protein